MDLSLVTTILLTFIIAIVLAKYIKILLERSNLPPGPLPLPIIGTLYKMNLVDIVKSLRNLSKTYGDIFTVYEGSQPIIVLCSYDAIKETLIDKPDEFSGRGYFPLFFDFTKGDDFAFSSGEKWKELRRFFVLTLNNFGVGKRSFEERIHEEAGFLCDVLRKTNGSPINPNYHIQRSVSNVICSVVFGSRFEYQDESFQTLLKCIQDNVYLLSTCWALVYSTFPKAMRYIPGPHHKITENFITMTNYIKKRSEQNMKTLDSNNPRDFMDCFLIKMEKERKKKETIYSPNTLVMCSMILFFSGTETINLTLKYALLFFLKHPEVAEKVCSEIDSIIDQRLPNFEDRLNMPYTEAFISEVQRYGDVAPFSLPHELTMDTQIRNYKLKKGTVFTPVLTSVHFDKTQFNNAENFDPKNFLDENGKFLKKESMTFSAGKRICPGRNLAHMELFIYITTLLQNFTIKSPVPPEKISVAPFTIGFGYIPPSLEIMFLPRTSS